MATEIEELRKVKLKKGYLVVGFPSTGLVGSIATSYLVDSLGMELIGYISSDKFAPIAAIHNYNPMPPARIHYSKKNNLVVLLSETAIPVSVSTELAEKILDYSKRIDARVLISLGGISMNEKPDDVYVITSKEEFVKPLLKKTLAKKIKEGATTGVTAVLLSEGFLHNIPVVSFLAESAEEADPKAASNVLKTLSKFLSFPIDTSVLEGEANELAKRAKSKLTESKIIKRKMGSMFR